jgi:hypothetical protein
LVAPSSQAIATQTFVTTTTFSVNYQAADAQSGVDHVRLFYRRNDGAWTQYPDAQTAYTSATGSIRFNAQPLGGDGTYDFYTLATDKAGHRQLLPTRRTLKTRR